MDQLMEKFKSEWANITTNCKKKVTWCDVESYGWALLSADFVVAIRCTAIWPQASLPNNLPHIRPESLRSEYDGPNVLNPWARTIHCPPHCFSWYFVIVLEIWVAHAPTSALSHTREDSLIGFSYTPHRDLHFSAGDFPVSMNPLTICFKITLKTQLISQKQMFSWLLMSLF